MEVNVNKKNYPEQFLRVSRSDNKFLIETSNCTLEVIVVTNRIIRFRYAVDFFAKDFSYAVNPDLKHHAEISEWAESETQIRISTPEMKCIIEKEKLQISLYNNQGDLLNTDAGGFHWEPNPGYGGQYVYCTKRIQSNENFFGLGDKATSQNLRGKRFLNWGTDTYGFAKEQDPLYRNIPFYYGLHNNLSYGIFFDNSFQTFFDFGKEDATCASFWAEGGQMCYYFIYAPTLLEVAREYVRLTGLPELPPRWALGYHQSKWSYYPESKVWELARDFRSKKIPCDVIHLDIDYMKGFRCFTWDEERFPDPKRMISQLREHGFRIIVIIDPGIKKDKDYWVFRQALENDYFCRRQDGDNMEGKVWPGDCYFPDFTNPDVRKWWSGLYKELMAQGVSGVWNDMNEPAVFEMGTFPDDVRHSYDGLNVSHRMAHNVYGMQMARATYEGIKHFNPDIRPFVLTRSGFSGVQRYAAVWTGDNVASWEHIWVANMQCQRLSISGISFCGTDIGGFIGEPDGELFVRYIQMAVFHPFFRGHSSSDQGDKEPWAFGAAYEALIRKAIELRYQLLPYIYTTFWQYVSNGTPMIRPLVFMSQDDVETHMRMDEFGFGDHLLICPINQSASSERLVYLPKGNWYYYWNDKNYRGGHEYEIEAPLDRFPFFVREGSVIPHQPVMQHTDENPSAQITLHVYYSVNRKVSHFYEDDGENYSYLQGNFSVKKFTVFGNRRQMRIICDKYGNYKPTYPEYRIVIHGLPFRPHKVIVDDKEISLPKRLREKTLTITAAEGFKRIEIF